MDSYTKSESEKSKVAFSLAQIATLKEKRKRLLQLVRDTEEAMIPYVRYFACATNSKYEGPSITVYINDKDNRVIFVLEKKGLAISTIEDLIALLKHIANGGNGNGNDNVLSDVARKISSKDGVQIWKTNRVRDEDDYLYVMKYHDTGEYSFIHDSHRRTNCPLISLENLIEVLETIVQLCVTVQDSNLTSF